ncbi:MAG: metallophosphoesterase, partial [Patescibacteria group bacterium]|nr:metallophosphoesterase [Patescibacteria group bacterium]
MIYIFLFAAIIFLIGGHWLVYNFFIQSFSVSRRRTKNILRLVFWFLPIGFIFFSFLVHWQEILLTKTLYFIFSLWLGVLINFLLVIGAAWLITGAGEAFGKKISPFATGIAVLALVLLFSGYGVFNALSPAVKRITVSLDNLPENWQGKTIVQISDLHLGEILGKNFLEQVVGKVNSLNPEMVVITGDLFDGMDGDLDSFVDPLNGFKAPVYYVTGNHEIYLGTERVLSVLRKTKINVLDDKIAEIEGLQIIGVSYPELGQKKDLESVKSNYNPEEPSILLYHAPVDVFSSQANGNNSHKDIYLSPKTDFTGTKEFGIDLQLSGH